jgi:hypothetical protein
MYRSLFAMLLVLLFSSGLRGQNKDHSWDDSLNINWPSEFRVVEIRSSADGSIQKARFHASPMGKGAPLIVSLHTWSGDYNQ